MKRIMVFSTVAVLLSCCTTWAGISAGDSISVNFDTASDADDFILIRDDTPSSTTLDVAQDPAIGTGTPASGGLEVINVGTSNGGNDIAALYTPGGIVADGAISLAAGETLTMTLKFKTLNTAIAATPRMGIASLSDVAAATSDWTVLDINNGRDIISGARTGINYADGIAVNLATTDDKVFNIVDVTGGGGRDIYNDPGGPYTLTDGVWYQFILDIIKSDMSDEFDVTATLNQLNGDGTDVASQIGNFSETIVNADLYADDFIAGFTVVHDAAADSVANEYDDLTITVIPEPATISLLALGMTALLRRKR